jgi:hypothetical protein
MTGYCNLQALPKCGYGLSKIKIKGNAIRAIHV